MVIFSRDLYRKIYYLLFVKQCKTPVSEKKQKIEYFFTWPGFHFLILNMSSKKKLRDNSTVQKKKDNLRSIFLRCSTSDIHRWVHRADVDERAFAEKKSQAKTTKTSRPKPQNIIWTPVLSITCTLANTKGNQFRGKIKFHISLRY